MSILKRIPLTYIGELHNIRLVNFWVDINEVREQVPRRLKIRNFNGKALISLVNVELEKMHPSFLPAAYHFHYRHVAFRLLLDDSDYNDGENKGVFFLRSFTQNKRIVGGGNLLTDYHLEHAEIRNLDRMMNLQQGNKYFNYAIDPGSEIKTDEEQRKIIGAIDRAYSMHDGQIKMVRIMREKWPIRQVECYLAETNFFETAKPASAFVVDEIIHYRWNAAENISKCAS